MFMEAIHPFAREPEENNEECWKTNWADWTLRTGQSFSFAFEPLANTVAFPVGWGMCDRCSTQLYSYQLQLGNSHQRLCSGTLMSSNKEMSSPNKTASWRGSHTLLQLPIQSERNPEPWTTTQPLAFCLPWSKSSSQAFAPVSFTVDVYRLDGF